MIHRYRRVNENRWLKNELREKNNDGNVTIGLPLWSGHRLK